MTDIKQQEALLIAEQIEPVHSVSTPLMDLHRKAASELRRLHAENALLHYTLTTYTDFWEAQAVEQTKNERLLEIQRDELLEALKQLAMWLPIMTKMAGMDAHETQVEFSEFLDDPCRGSEIISIASSMAAAKDAIAKAEAEAEGKKQ